MDNSALMKHLNQLFAECDVDNNGCLGREEFSELCAKIGLDKEAAQGTFDRLDIDKDDKITFEEFAAGFNQYRCASASASASASGMSSPNQAAANSNQPTERLDARSPSEHGPSTKKPPSPASTLARKNASPVGVMSLGAGSRTASGTSSSSANPMGLAKTVSSSGGGSADISDFNGGAGGSSSFDTAGSSYAPLAAHQSTTSDDQHRLDDSMVVYSGEATGGQDYYDQPAGSSQFNSLFGGSLNGSGSFSQVRNMQELLDCVQKLQSENQILTQIFFKDKREREEYISQLGEEFDQQVREVEERANRRAREELENEKKRLREMMQTERETLQHHYKTIEKMSKLIQGPQNSRSANDLLIGGEGIDKVKSKLEDTYLENRQLKRSLLDTKTDVAMIWKEMEKLKRQYEDKLSSAYQKNDETRSECDDIKQQLNLMKDSNRKLQDASDVITTYITDKVEPVIKGATDSSTDQYLSPNGCQSLTGSFRMAGSSSQSNSRRGSVLSEYLNSHPDSMEDYLEDEQEQGPNGQGSKVHQKQTSRSRTKVTDLGYTEYDARSTTATTTSSISSSGGGGGVGGSGVLPRINLPNKEADSPVSGECRDAEVDRMKKSSSLNPLTTNNDREVTETLKKAQAESKQTRSKLQATSSQLDVSKSGSSLKNLGRHFFLGSKDKVSASTLTPQATKGEQKLPTNKTKSMSLDHCDHPEPLVEPADGLSVATFNIILVGDSFVGKSSFAARFMEGNFVQGLISNCSIDFKTKAYKVDGINYTVNLWDTAKADGIILMYDVTDKRSYLNVRNWMSTISDTAAENVAILLVGNKIDLREDKNKDKCVPHSEGFRLSKEYDIEFLETSVKTGTNLIPSMGRLIKLIAKNNSPEEKDDDRIRLNDKNRTFHCMPKNC